MCTAADLVSGRLILDYSKFPIIYISLMLHTGSAINMCTLLNDTDIPRELQILCSELTESVDMTMQVPSDSITPFATVLSSSTGILSETALSLLDISLPTIGFDQIESEVFSPTPTSFINSLAPSFSISSVHSLAITESLLLTNTYFKVSGEISLSLATQSLPFHMMSIEPDFVSPTLNVENLELQTTNIIAAQTISNSFTSTITPFSTFGFRDELESSIAISSNQFIVNPTLVISPTSQLDYDGLESELVTSEFEIPISTVIGTNLMMSSIISADATSDVLIVESSVLLTSVSTSSIPRNLESSMHISMTESIGILESTFVVEPTPTVTDQTSLVEPSIQLSSISLSTLIPGLTTAVYQSSVTPEELITIAITISDNFALEIETTPLTSIESTPFVTTSLFSKDFISVAETPIISTTTVELSSSLMKELFTADGSSLGSFTEIENTPTFSPSPTITIEAVTSMYDATNPSSTVMHLPLSSLDVEMSISNTGSAFTTDLLSSILTSSVILPAISVNTASTSLASNSPLLIGDAISLSSVSFSPSIAEAITGEPASLMATLTASFTLPEPSPSVFESVLIVASSDMTSQSPNVSFEEMVTTSVVLSSVITEITSMSSLSMAILSASSSVKELQISSFITVEQTMMLHISSPAPYTQSSASTAVASFSQAFSPSISSSVSKEEITNNLLFLTPSSLFSNLASTSYTFTTSMLRPTSSISAEQIQSSLIRLIIRTTFLEYQPLKNSTSRARTDLEIAIIDVYVDALRGLGANKRKRQTTETATAEVGACIL